ncbi:SDR family NAD(P)-dependent oxidoreductase [Paenibacillus nuruki]|uniref:SDR family NAD(P)-dependent oxidoreductase n=1 Tax=Paenibacillus nuruki TaxID=1886670 RepID=UPI0028058922|nr:SDR family NAD(P)-dependent oxidoreductase [Paenibacillus nuruki]CAJ1315147.1 Polyketide synthase PksL [Paenibacillus nuruki]
MDSKKTDIAIVGISCRFPDANGYDEFWDNLEAGVNSIQEIPADRWNIQDYYSADVLKAGKTNSKWCGAIDHVYDFDHRFFNISPREVNNMDPQQRLLLEETWHCIEDSGISLSHLQQQITSVYAGIMSADYLQEISSLNHENIDSYACLGTYESLLTNRISYILNLKGMSMPINAACASSLVAVHEARRALIDHDCDYAIASAVNLNLHPMKYVSFAQSRMLSPDGQCKTFDQQANGYVPGDGVAVLLLQRLDQAIEDGNHIYGVIRGSAVNHVGKSVSLTAPKMEAQQKVIQAAYQSAGVKASTINYIEAHGTGTSLGDPIEIEALTQAFRTDTLNNGFCQIGSVKTNIGHLESAAGMAGIIKVLMMMKHKKIPPSLNIQTLNPIIDFESTPFQVTTKCSVWESIDSEQPLRAGISSFGFGGVNSHVLLEEYRSVVSESDAVVESSLSTPPAPFIVLSSKTIPSLKQLIENWKSWIQNIDEHEYSLNDICRTLLQGRESFSYRVGSIVSSINDIKKWLEIAASHIVKAEMPNWSLDTRFSSWKGYADITSSAINNHLYKQKQAELLNILQQLTEDSQKIEGYYQDIWLEENSELYTFISGYSYVYTLIELTTTPEWVTVFGKGTWVGLAISEVLPITTIIKLLLNRQNKEEIVFKRPSVPLYIGNGQSIMPLIGDAQYVQYLSKQLSELAQDQHILLVQQEHITKAKILYAHQYTFKSLLDEWNKVTQEKYNIDIVKCIIQDEQIKSDYPITHINMMLLLIIVHSLRKLKQKWNLSEPYTFDHQAWQELIDLLDDEIISKQDALEIILYSNQNDEQIAYSLSKQLNNINKQNNYSILYTHNRTLNEIDHPSDWLAYLVGAKYDSSTLVEDLIAQSMITNKESLISLDGDYEEQLLQLWLNGVDIRWDVVYDNQSYTKVSLPLYAFQRSTFRLKSNLPTAQKSRLKDIAAHPMLQQNRSTADQISFQSTFTGEEFFLLHHHVQGIAVLPGVAYLEMAVAALQKASGMLAKVHTGFVLRHVTWNQPIYITDKPIDVHVHLHSEKQEQLRYEIAMRHHDSSLPICGHGMVTMKNHSVSNELNIYPEELKRLCTEQQWDATTCYKKLNQWGLNYGDSHQGIDYLWIDQKQAVARIKLPTRIENTLSDYILHPTMLDSAFQAAILFTMSQEGTNLKGKPQLPFALEELEYIQACTPTMWARICWSEGTTAQDKVQKLDINLYNDSGQLCIRISKYTARTLEGQLLEPTVVPVWTELPEHLTMFASIWDTFSTDKIVALDTSIINLQKILVIGSSDIQWNAISSSYPNAIRWQWDTDQTIDSIYQSILLHDQLDHIVWIASDPPLDTTHSEAIIYGQEQGVIRLFRLIKSLLQHHYDRHSLEWTIVTMNTQYVSPSEEVKPIQSSISGFIGSLAKEIKNWRFRVVDLEQTKTIDWQFLFSLPTNPDGNIISYRRLQWHEQQLIPVQYKAIQQTAYRKNGVYIVIGGAGGIGEVWSEYMIREYQAKIIWIGRRRINQQIEASLRHLSQYGTAPEYISADAANPDELERVYQEIIERYPQINGVIHAAIALLDNTVIQMDEERFRGALTAKVNVCASIEHVFQKVSLDFVLFFSSINAFAKPAGQSNYAAGCTFKDSFAQYLSSHWTCSVKVMNWGYWGNVGTVASRNYRERMLKQGIGSIEPQEAMQALEWLLVSPFQQIGLVKQIDERNVYHLNEHELMIIQ